MAKFPPPDPNNVAALEEAVRDVFRAIPDNPFRPAAAPRQARPEPTNRDSVIDDILNQIISGVTDGSIDTDGLFVKISVHEAGGLLVAAMLYAAEHGRTLCKYDEFTKCNHARTVVYYAAQVFTQIIEEASR